MMYFSTDSTDAENEASLNTVSQQNCMANVTDQVYNYENCFEFLTMPL